MELTARERLGITHLHPEQREVIEAVLGDHDALAVLPTGFGKSLIYQVSALLLPRPTLVISPLLALMADQEQRLRGAGIPVVRLDSTLRVGERREALERLAAGGSLVVLTTPESLQSGTLAPALRASRPALLCVDEAHCISEWGHDFRPDYLRIGLERAALGEPVVLGLTATATTQVRTHIIERLRMRDPVVVAAPPYRENLRLSVWPVEGDAKIALLGRRLRRLSRPGIAYCSTTAAVDGIWAALQGPRARRAIPAVRYHGKLSDADRRSAQTRFMHPRSRLVMIATSAFGMGIDKPNIRTIIHYQAPGSLEQYVQEAGRAGRDGKPASCELLFDPADLKIHRFLQRRTRPSPRQLQAIADALLAYAGEQRWVTQAELAVSAGAPRTVVGSMVADLEALGLVERDEHRRLQPRVEAEALRAGTRELARRLEALRRGDDARLQAVADYALTSGCRSVFLRRYFGEADPPVCGLCDRCRAASGGRGSR